jgi:hypothetical protein
MKKQETETKPTETTETKRPALARSKNAVKTALRAGAGKADLVDCI